MLTLSALREGGAIAEDVVAMIVEASFDPEIPAMNNLPRGLDEAGARVFFAQSDGVVLRLDGEPVGLVVAHAPDPGDGVEVPPSCAELDEWVLAPFRGLGLLGKRGAWPLIAAWLAQRFEHVLASAWSHNHAAHSLVRARGYRHVGRTHWVGPRSSGFCEVFLYDLAPHRGKS